MQENYQQQPQIKILPAVRFNNRLRMGETAIEEVVQTVREVLPINVYGYNDVTVTLVEKNLKIMADMVLMKKTLTHLVRNLMAAISGYGHFLLTINQVNFEMESLLNGDEPIIGACAFIPFTGVGTYISVDEKIKEKMLEPFFTTKTDGNGLCLAMAYRIIKRHRERIKVKNQVEQGAEVNMYLPLTKLELVNMMSMPAG